LYYPFGEARWTTGTLPTDFSYTNQRIDDKMRLLDYHARFYDPYLNRWIQPDTIVPEAGNPQDFNRYSYVRNNPVHSVDPDGRCTIEYDPFTGTYGGQVCFGDETGMGRTLTVDFENGQAGQCGTAAECRAAENRLIRDLWLLAATSLLGPFAAEVAPAFGLSGLGVTAAEAACADGDCTNEVKGGYEIGEEGAQLVFGYLNDPTLRREVMVYVQEAGKRANYFARLDGLTSTAIHEVKNVGQLSLSQDFMNQARTYTKIADGLGVDLHYWLLRSAPERVVTWLQELGVIVHTGFPEQ
jgi:RHS repeat-associated protein